MKSSQQAAAIAAKSKHPVESMRWEPSDNGGFVSHTTMRASSRKPGALYQESPTDTQVHPSANHLAAHVKAMANLGKASQSATPGTKTQGEWAGLANQMMASGVGPPRAGNGCR